MEMIGSVMCQKNSMIFRHHDMSAQLSDVSPRSGNQSKNEPPANSTISRMANRKPGTAYPTMIRAEVHTSNGAPSSTALRMPSGIEIRFASNAIQMPSEIETGSFS